MREQMLFEKHLLDLQREEQKKQSLLLMEKAQQTKRQRHDLRHQLKVIQAAREHQGDTRFEANGTVFRSSVYLRLSGSL